MKGLEKPDWMSGTIALDQALPRRPELIPLTGGVYAARGFGISNIVFVVTARSVVVIDSSESVRGASAALAELRKICTLPISHLIYTHYHDDHIRGARAFCTPGLRVIAQRRFPELLDKWERLRPYHSRRVAQQFDHPPLVPALEDFYVPPDVLVDEEHEFEEGGIVFRLSHTQGETVDHLMVWLPRSGVICPGDLFYPSFPMMGSPMNTDERPALAWAESLDRMRTLKPTYLVAGHGQPIVGAGDIDSVLANYAEAIRFVHDETLRGINEGLRLEQIRRRVRLPERLAQLPYLRQTYGTVRWSVNGVFRQYTSWYSLNPKDLDPSVRAAVCKAVVKACGGPAALNEQAQEALEADRNHLVLELVDLVLTASEQDEPALELRAEALRRLAGMARNHVARNIYRTALSTQAGPIPAVGSALNS